MRPLHIFFIVALLALGLGWFGLGLVECGAILLGAVIVVFAAERVHDAEAALRLSTCWIGALVLGASIAIAGAFDLFDAGRHTELGDWDTGFVLGLALFAPIALLYLLINRRRSRAAARDRKKAGMADAGDRDAAGLVALVLGVVVTEFIASFLADERSTVGRVADAILATAVGYGASVIVQFRVGKAPGGARLLGDLAAAALIATGLVLPGRFSLLSIVLFGVAWGFAMVGVTYSRPERAQGTAVGVFKRGALTGMVNAVVLCVLAIGALAPRADLSVVGAVAVLEDLVPLPQWMFARLIMSDRYLWAHVPVLDRGGPDRDPQDVIEARRYPQDKWSGVLSATLSHAILRGETSEGVDFLDADGATIVGQVHPESPAAAAGVKRGWRLSSARWQDATKLKLSFTDPDGTPHEVELPGSRETVPASWWSVVEHEGRKVGYFYLSGFHAPSVNLLTSSFAALKREGVEDLVVDLRYNTGGSLRVARMLASLIAGPAMEGKVFERVIHNGRYRDWDKTLRFERHTEALGLKRVFVLTTKDTCSASESVIMGLAPHIQVVKIGGTTCGKPVGYSPLDYRGVSYWVVDFRSRNAAGQGDYFDGLAPTCHVKEDLRQSLGATNEALFAGALHYMSRGRCRKS